MKTFIQFLDENRWVSSTMKRTGPSAKRTPHSDPVEGPHDLSRQLPDKSTVTKSEPKPIIWSKKPKIQLHPSYRTGSVKSKPQRLKSRFDIWDDAKISKLTPHQQKAVKRIRDAHLEKMKAKGQTDPPKTDYSTSR